MRPMTRRGEGFSVPVDYPLTDEKLMNLRADFADTLDALDAAYGEWLRNV